MELNIINRRKFVFIGLTASLLLLAVYFGIMSVTSSFSGALEQFSFLWYWILILVAGFGVQAGLYFFVRSSLKLKQSTGATASVAVSGGVSAGSMVACCLHHIADVLPLLGLAAATTFLSTYQIFFIVVGILSNIIGITIMLEVIQKHNLSEGVLKLILVYNMNTVKKITIGLSLAIALVVLIFSSGFLLGGKEVETPSENTSADTIVLSKKSSEQNGITFDVDKARFVVGGSANFDITITTHSGSLDFDMAKVSYLTDDNGTMYQPLQWQGSGPGGHHRSGTLMFSGIKPSAKAITLTIQDNSSTLPYVFEWSLN